MNKSIFSISLLFSCFFLFAREKSDLPLQNKKTASPATGAVQKTDAAIAIDSVRPGAYYYTIKNTGSTVIDLKTNDYTMQVYVNDTPASEYALSSYGGNLVIKPGEKFHGTPELPFGTNLLPGQYRLKLVLKGRIADTNPANNIAEMAFYKGK